MNTYPTQFDYSITGIAKPADAFEAQSVSAPTTKHLIHYHESAKYGGYIVHITPKAGLQTPPSVGAMTITILAETSEWRQTFAGAFSVSGLTDPAYGVRDEVVDVPATATEPAKTRIVSRFVDQRDRRSAVSYEPAAFVHVMHSRAPVIGGTFGLGLRTTGLPSYYAGLSLFASDKAAITFGIVAGSLKTPPAGVNVGDSVATANVANNLPSRTAVRGFVGFSFNFLGNAKEALSKPFKDTQEPTAPGPPPSAAADTKAGAATPPTDATTPTPEQRAAATLEIVGVQAVALPRNTPVELRVRVAVNDTQPVRNVEVQWAAADSENKDFELTGPNPAFTDSTGQATIRVGLSNAGKAKRVADLKPIVIDATAKVGKGMSTGTVARRSYTMTVDANSPPR